MRVEDKEDLILRGIFVSDIHFGATKDADRLYSELNKYLLKKVRTLCKERKLDYVIIGGDLYDREVGMNEKPGRLASKFILTLNNLSIKYGFFLGIIKGTLRHDYNQLEVFRKLELTNKNFRIFSTCEEYILDEEGYVRFLMIPEEYMEDPDEFYSEVYHNNTEDTAYDFIFGHGTFDFAGYVSKLLTSEQNVKNAPTFKAKQFKDMTLGCTLFGHIHIKTEDEENGVYYPGSFSRSAFGEEEKKGYYYIEYNLETCETSLEFIINKGAPTYKTIDGDLLPTDIVKKSKKLEKLKEKYDFIRIKSTRTVQNDTDLQILQNYAEKDDNVKVEIKKIEIEDDSDDHTFDFIINRECSFEESISRFIKIKTGEVVSENDVKNILS